MGKVIAFVFKERKNVLTRAKKDELRKTNNSTEI